MSLCHPSDSKFSCGACCGLWNLDLNQEEREELLWDRTQEFRSSVSYGNRGSVAAFRQSREKKEEPILKKDHTIYNCPYLGYLPDSPRIGCMIHPTLTGDPKSQNFSFYGASICQTYDCKNKSLPHAANWLAVFIEISETYDDYTTLASDHKMVSLLERLFARKKISIQEGTQLKETKMFLRGRLELDRNLTSFEVEWEGPRLRDEEDSLMVERFGEILTKILRGISSPSESLD